MGRAGIVEEEKAALRFSVASKLWRELGERLVGRSPIALAELVKNSYDADAKRVRVEVDPQGSRIEVDDDGHGMTWNEFADHWATVGDTHKERLEHSRECKRPLTGSKGVGRISTRVLADQLELRTVSKLNPHLEIVAEVDWKKALELEFLTETPITCRKITHSEPQAHGTRVVLTKLREPWTEETIMDLAAEVWKLQPPFPHLKPRRSKCPFAIEFHSPQGELTAAFTASVRKVLDAYEARLTGSLGEGTMTATLEFAGEPPIKLQHQFGEGLLSSAKFEIRVYRLKGRQRGGVKLKDVVDYLENFRGVHIYDAGFRLPYYGYAEADWLGLTLAQTRRLSESQLLPRDLQVPEGLQHLPHVDHLLGAVTVDTANEPDLDITIGRDRLKEGAAFGELRDGIRTAIDWYAMEKAKRRYQAVDRAIAREPPSTALKAVMRVVDDFEDQLPSPTAQRLRKGIQRAIKGMDAAERSLSERSALLGSLATAGVAAVAYQHEMAKQTLAMEGLLERMEATLVSDGTASDEATRHLIEDMRSWLERTKAIGNLFSHFATPENVKRTDRYLASKVVGHVLREISPLLPGVTYSQSIEPTLHLPPAPLADWIAILQNVLFNASNAMQEADVKRIRFVGKSTGNRGLLSVQDTGHGIDLAKADKLFEPFERAGHLTPERRAAGFGGMGLGLTIVRLVAQEHDCEVGFVEPEPGFATAFQLTWREPK